MSDADTAGAVSNGADDPASAAVDGPASIDALAELRTPAWARLLKAARRHVERAGELTGTVALRDPSDAERHLISGMTGAYRSTSVRTVRVSVADLDDDLRDRCGMGIFAVLAALAGPVRNRPGERRDEEAAKREALADARGRAGDPASTAAGWAAGTRVSWAAGTGASGRASTTAGAPASRLAGHGWFERWLATVETDGTVTRLVRGGQADTLSWAVEVLRRLPAQAMPLPVLAELATGDTKALAQTPLATLVLRALALRDDVPAPRSRADARRLWEAAGVIVDDLASQVLVLNLATDDDHVVADWLRDAADFGIPFRLTLHQLMIDPLVVTSPDVYVCENPAVLRAAAAELADSSAALVCSEGQPSQACHRLLERATGRVHWRGDFDFTGLRTTAMAIDRYRALPWRMSAADYLAGLEDGSTEPEPLKGPPTESPWDTELAATMAARGRAVMEERLLPRLLADLTC